MLRSVSPQVDFVALEQEMLAYWQKEQIVEAYLTRNKNETKYFSFLDGPITANNPMGLHHAWGRTFKDIWQRFWNMRGYNQRFQNGFDCQGLWVEVEVEKELGITNKRDIENLVAGDKEKSIAHFVSLCKKRVEKFSQIQTEQSKRLGYFMDWDHSYFTMSDENNYMIWYFLKVCFEKGWIYKGKDSVPWCPRCQTAISQHEMLTEDYKELTHETAFVKLPLKNSPWENASVVIWTTTPWTIPANVAVGVNTTFTYGIWEEQTTKEKLIFIHKDPTGVVPTRTLKGKSLPIDAYMFANLPEGISYTLVDTISGEKLIGYSYDAPFDALPIVTSARKENEKLFHTIVDASKIVTSEEGTGLLHIATGAGKEDFDLGKEYGLPIISPILDDATYSDTMGELSGKNAKKHPELIFDFLKSHENGKFFLKSLHFTHRYPACWRCKTELVWKVAQEWYIAMDTKDQSGKTFREQMMTVAKEITWLPDFGLDRELDWLSNMHDWLISKKNRYWGLALPIYECNDCGTFSVIGGKEELKEKAVSGWDTFEGNTPHKPYIDAVTIACPSCKKEISRIDDVGNVWLDAGIVPFSTILDPNSKQVSYQTDKKEWEKWFPFAFVTESFPGQFKNWFYALIAMSTALENKAPFQHLLGFATMVDEKGEAFHKSKGNALEFVQAADTFGADVIRWVCVRHDIATNIQFGQHTANQIRRDFHLKLWNIYNFFVTYALSDGWEKKQLPSQSLPILDQWILSRLEGVTQSMTTSMESYNAKDAVSALEKLVDDMSLWYVRRSRDRIGPTAEDEKDKASCYHTLYTLLVTVSKLIAPFMPFFAEALYTNLTGEKSVHLADWPQENKKARNTVLEKEMSEAMAIASLIHAKRKEAGIKVKIPLRTVSYQGPQKLSGEVESLIMKETNVYKVPFTQTKEETYVVTVEVSEDNQDKKAGQAREIIRQIQEERKKLGTKLTEYVVVQLPSWPEEFTEDIKKKALVRKLTKGDSLIVQRV